MQKLKTKLNKIFSNNEIKKINKNNLPKNYLLKMLYYTNKRNNRIFILLKKKKIYQNKEIQLFFCNYIQFTFFFKKK